MYNIIVNNVRNILIDNGVDAFLSYMPHNRRYLSGFTGSTGYVLITKDKNLFCTDFRYIERAMSQCINSEIVKIDNNKTIYDIMNNLGLKKVYIEDDFMTIASKKEFDHNCENIKFLEGSIIIKELRGIKNEQEISYIKKSCSITCEVFEELLNYVEVGISELQLVDKVRELMKRYGADEPMFITVLAGQNTSMSHGLPSEYKIEYGDFVTVDIGSLFKGYGSDLTRTFVVGKSNEKQREIYGIVLNAQLKAMENIRVGITGIELDKIARDYIKSFGYEDNFGHGLGHGVGLQLADLPRVTFAKEGQNIIKENMVMTNEPGIYIPKFGGVRIEDTVLVTKYGYEILTPLDKKLLEI